MKTAMDMDSYEIEQDTMEIEYGDEIMSTGWNPAVDLVCEQLLQAPADNQLVTAEDIASLETPADVSMAVSELFLRKMYSYQR